MKLAVLALGLAIAAQQPAPAAELKTKFERRIQEITSRLDGVAGYELVDLTSGEKIAHLERETFPTASTIKLAIVYELFKQAAEGRIKLEETMPLDRSKAVGGTGVLVEMGTPTLSIRGPSAGSTCSYTNRTVWLPRGSTGKTQLRTTL